MKGVGGGVGLGVTAADVDYPSSGSNVEQGVGSFADVSGSGTPQACACGHATLPPPVGAAAADVQPDAVST